MTGETALVVLLVLASPAVGSFLGVLADRLPRGEDWIARPSACRACGARLGARELVPLVSYLAQRGRCRACGAEIPKSLPLAEIAAVAAAIAAAFSTEGAAQMLAAAGWLWCLVALALADAQWFRLPDSLVLALAGFGLALATLTPGRGPAEALVSGTGFAAALWLIRAAYHRARGREGLGLGDVKVAAGIGAGLGAWLIPAALLLASALALAVAAARVAAGDRAAGRGDAELPFGLYLCLAAALVWVGAATSGSTFAAL